ncbi:MAG: hypothetical protein ACOYT8_01695 [Candidatus Dependentiae bacterium]
MKVSMFFIVMFLAIPCLAWSMEEKNNIKQLPKNHRKRSSSGVKNLAYDALKNVYMTGVEWGPIGQIKNTNESPLSDR